MRRFLVSALLVLVLAGLVGFIFWIRRSPPKPLTDGPWVATVTTIAGRGAPGLRDGPASLARFSEPFAVLPGSDGTLYVADAGSNDCIRAIGLDGRVRTIACSGTKHPLRTPSGVAAGRDGSLVVALTGSHQLVQITREGAVVPLAGDGVPGWRDGVGARARFNGPVGIASARDDVIVVADTYNDAIRAVDGQGRVTTIAGGSGPGYLDGPAERARFDTPAGVAVAADGTILVADTGNGVVRRIGRDRQVTTVWQTAIDANSDVSLYRPVGIAVSREGTIYVTDRRGRVMQIMADGRARVLAGTFGGYADGLGANARFHNPTGIAVEDRGSLVVADASNALIRRIAPAGLRDPDPPRSPIAPSPGLSRDAIAQWPLAWPLDPQFAWHEVAGTMGEARGSVADTRERFHAGVDVHAADGTPVLAVRSGVVDSLIAAQGFGTLSENLAVGPFTYVHMRVGRRRGDLPFDDGRFVFTRDETGSLLRVRVRRGTRFAIGDELGTVNRFNHVHLNTGAPGREINPLTLRLAGFLDTVRPTIARRGVQLFTEGGLPLTAKSAGRLIVSGPVRIVVDAYDQVDGNARRRRLGIYSAGYQVLDADGSPAPGFEQPRTTMTFDRLPRDDRAAQLVFAEGSGISVYGNRRTRFLYNVTNVLEDGEARPDVWDTAALTPGLYTLRVIVADAAGNEAIANRDVPVVIVPGGEDSPTNQGQSP